MIAKIRKGKSFAGLGRYLFGPGRNEEHLNPRIVAGESVMLDHTRGWRPWVADMAWCAERNEAVRRPVWHCSLRAAPEDPVLPDALWAAIAWEHVTAMGLAEHPWVAVRHGDDHIHIVACRVDGHGSVWSDRHDYARAMKSVRAIETRHELTAWTPTRVSGRLAATTIAERERAARRGTDPERVQLREAMHAAAAAAANRGLAVWHRELENRGVKCQAKTNRDRRVIGYRVTLDGWMDSNGDPVWLKASQVDRRLSWPKLRAQLGADAPDRDRLPPTTGELARAFPGPLVPVRQHRAVRRTTETGRSPTRKDPARRRDREDPARR